MDTIYIGPHAWEKVSGAEVQRELRVEDSEAYPGQLQLGTFTYETGDQMGAAFLDRKQAAELRDALNAFLGEA
jgi:hypothetical protein